MKRIEKLEFIERVASLFVDVCSDDVAFFIGCQFALESSFGDSSLSVNHANYCGMRCPVTRITTDLRGLGGSKFAYYSHLKSCVLDYKLWLAWNHFTSYILFNLDLFTRKLVASGYCPDDDYISKINSIYSQFKTFKNECRS